MSSKGLIARQAAQQYAYEDRIAELRAQIDRTTSRQLLDQEQFEQKLDELLRRQAALESRADGAERPRRPGDDRLDQPATGGSDPNRSAIHCCAAAARPWHSLEPSRAARAGKQADIGTKLGRVEASLDRVERHQTAALDADAARYEGRTRQVRAVLDDLGLKFNADAGGNRRPVRAGQDAAGKPKFRPRADAGVSIARAHAEELGNTLDSVPLRKPLTGELDMTSPFGVRIDPFVHEAVDAYRHGFPRQLSATRSTPRRPAR